MVNLFKRGWDMATASLAVLKSHPSLLVFPIVSGITMAGVTVLAGWAAMKAVGLVALLAWYFVCAFVVVFCNAALVACVLQSSAGRQPSIGSGFAAAGRRLPQILGWSLVVATIGVVLQVLQSLLRDKLALLGGLLGGATVGLWGVATYFVVPVIVTEGVGPVKAVKRSSGILRRTWGESLIGSFGISLMLSVFLLPLGAVVAVLVKGVGRQVALVTLGAIGVLYALLLAVVFTTLSAIFRASMYSYATTGTAPNHMDAALLRSVFRSQN